MDFPVPDPSTSLQSNESIASVTTWRNVARRQASKMGREEDRRSLSCCGGRSVSPRRPAVLAGDVEPRRRPFELLRKTMSGYLNHISYRYRLFTIPDPTAWHPLLFSKGVLILPDKRSEIRMRILAMCLNSTPQFMRQVLETAIKHRLTFRIGVKMADLIHFSPQDTSLTDRVGTSYLYELNYQEQSFIYTSTPAFVAAYIARLLELLKRPHAPAFIGLGGPYSWTAQRWGGNRLVSAFMSGPSIQTALHFRGETDSKYPDSLRVSWDQVSGQDIQILFGHVPLPISSSRD
jgi:hypothetical protein